MQTAGQPAQLCIAPGTMNTHFCRDERAVHPEADGVFLCQEFHVGFFVRMNITGGPVDVWAVSGTFEDQMIDNGSGFFYFPSRIPATQVTLTEWP
jgi:hypothetical protein